VREENNRQGTMPASSHWNWMTTLLVLALVPMASGFAFLLIVYGHIGARSATGLSLLTVAVIVGCVTVGRPNGVGPRLVKAILAFFGGDGE
jgi:hypothetical protein